MNAKELISLLKLERHPKESGYFVETFRSHFSTAIYFLVTSDGMSEMHRLKKDELFHFYAGAPAEVLLLGPDTASGQVITIGNNLTAGDTPQLLIPAGVWQGMRTTGDFTLIGCTVAPPFEYLDYEAGNRAELIRQFPSFEERIVGLTR